MRIAIRLSIFLGLICSYGGANATITINSVSGSSSYVSSSATIYGGIAGVNTSVSDGIKTVSTCQTQNIACNRKAIYPSTELVINFSSDTVTNGVPFMRNGDEAIEGTKTVNANSSTIRITWERICSELNNDNTCANDFTDSSVTLSLENGGTTDSATIAISLLGESLVGPAVSLSNCSGKTAGYCNWEAIRGDSKVAIVGGELYGETSDVKEVLVMYGDNYSQIDVSELTSSNNQILQWDEENKEVVSEIVSGLSNGTYYDFKTAIVDKAENFYGFFSASDFESGNNCGAGSSTAGAEANVTVNMDPDNGCQHSALPIEVEGLLEEDVNCFISTAAYGSSFSSKVETFRKFRNTFMTQNKMGVFLIYKYYNLGPKLARGIYGNNLLKAVTRVALYPLWAFATISLKFGLLASTLILISLFSVIIFFFNRRKIFN